jgi:cobalamin biosynthesis Co2+ chelatase CbiK
MTELAERVDELVGATKEYDRSRAEAVARVIERSIWSADAIDVTLAKRALNALKQQNYFDLMIMLGDSILQTGQTDRYAASMRRR